MANNTLVIDTSFGATVAVVGNNPHYESDSRSHVEKLQPNIAYAIKAAGLQPSEISTIIVGNGPAPFTGLRAGIVAARALAFATGATLLGQNVLEPQAAWNNNQHSKTTGSDNSEGFSVLRLTLAVNDARRKQLYYALYDSQSREVLPMDIAPATDIAAVVYEYIQQIKTVQSSNQKIIVDILGPGTEHYSDAWGKELAEYVGAISDFSMLHDAGAAGVETFAQIAIKHYENGDECSTEPLYLRRPDISIPNASKHKLGQTAISLPAITEQSLKS